MPAQIDIKIRVSRLCSNFHIHFFQRQKKLNTKLTNSSFTYSEMGGDYNNKLNSAYCIYNNDIVFAHLTLEIPDGLANGTLLATFPNGVNLKTSLGIGVSSATGAISTINAINNCIYSAGSMHAGNYILDMVFKRA